MHPPRFVPNLLRLAIAASVLYPGAILASPGLQPAPGPAGTPAITPHHGVPVIDIVAPSANGLSHNQFLDYNVGQAGVVLNNALHAGDSLLAGALGANPQFHGQAASTILNEVISRNASAIEGPQEIFGRPADYILANPNGITVNGASFINTTKAGFLVGGAEIEDQRIRHLDTLDSKGVLTVGRNGLSNYEGALALVAPRIVSHGTIHARSDQDLEMIAGRNRIDYATSDVIQHQPGTPGSIDASLFGAVQAGRIRIISTAEGAGVRIGAPTITARHGINVRSAGDLQLDGSARRQSHIDSGDGALDLHADGDLHVSAVDARAGQIEVRAGKRLTLDGKTRETIERDNENWDKKWWFITTETYNRERTVTERTSHGSQLAATGDISLEAGGSLELRNARVSADADLAVRSGDTLTLSAGVDSRQVDETVRHRKHLWRGDKDGHSYRETARPSELSGRNLTLQASERAVLAGSKVHSRGELNLRAPELEIDVAQLNSNESTQDYRGDLVSGAFFGQRGSAQAKTQKSQGSQVVSDGTLTVIADQVRISGSRVASKGDALLVSEKAALSVGPAAQHASRSTSQSDSQLFGLIETSSGGDKQSDSVLISDLASDSNLRLASADELRVIGAKLQAGGELQLDAAKDLAISAATETGSATTQDSDQGFYANAQETAQALDGKPGSKQYSASAGYQVTRRDSSDRNTALKPSLLSGSSIKLGSQAAVNVDSSNLDAQKGAIAISGKQVNLLAQSSEQTLKSTTTRTGGGVAVTGGMDRIGSGNQGFRQQQIREEITRTPRATELKAAGDVRIDATALVNEAAKVDAKGELQVKAEQVENRASASVHEVRERENNWQGHLGLSLEVRDLTRPIENLITGNEPARFQQASVEDALAPPTLGIDLSLDHLNRQQTDRAETAHVSELAAGSVKVNADSLTDSGTHYRAATGPVQIEARTHAYAAARDSKTGTVERLDVNGGLRVETATGKDIAVRLSGKGGSLTDRTETVTVHPGSLYGQQGIQVQLGSDGLYEGTALNGGTGSVSVAAAGDLNMTQANDRQHSSLRKLDGSGWVKGGNTPAGNALELRGYLDNTRRASTDTQARAGSIDAEGVVQLSSGGEMSLTGTRIGDPKARTADIRLDAQGPLRVLAATDTHKAEGKNLGGGGEVMVKKSDAGTGGGLGGHFSNGRIAENSSTATGAVFTAKNTVALSSKSHLDDAVHLQGLQVSAREARVAADNGGALIASASSREHRDNLGITAGAGFSRTPADSKADTKKALHGRAQFSLDQLDAVRHLNSELNAQQVSLSSLNDMNLKGARVNAERINGQVGGDLLVASQVDRVNALKLDVDARLSQEKNPQGYLNATRSFSGPFSAGAEKKVGAVVQKADPGFSPTLDFKVDHTQLSSVAQPSRMVGRDGIDLEVSGEVRLSGADLRSPGGKVELGSERMSKETLNGRDYHRVFGTNLSNAPIELGTDLVNTYKDGAMALENGDVSTDLGLIRTGGHDRTISVGSQVIEKR